MNFAFGSIIDAQQAENVLENIGQTVSATLKSGSLSTLEVIKACGCLSESLNEAEHLPLLLNLGFSAKKASEELKLAKLMLSESYLTERVKKELGGANDVSSSQKYTPYACEYEVTEKYMPLGVLFHIAAGNMDALPVFSVIEGLLTGNINILKLPADDGGLSVIILSALVGFEPKLAEYIYVFGVSSQDLTAMKKMAQASSAVVIWGGDDAVRSVRSLCEPNTKIIEWGHKLSFGYVSRLGAKSEKALRGLAYNIAKTNQLYCNSCQGIYFETDNECELIAFAQEFYKILQQEFACRDNGDSLQLKAQKTLLDYTQRLCREESCALVLGGKGCSVYVYTNKSLSTSNQFGNCWVRGLAGHEIISALYPYKGYLQTVGLCCADSEKEELQNAFFKAGAVRCVSGELMSEQYCGAAHDGEYPLQRYVKRVCSAY